MLGISGILTILPTLYQLIISIFININYIFLIFTISINKSIKFINITFLKLKNIIFNFIIWLKDLIFFIFALLLIIFLNFSDKINIFLRNKAFNIYFNYPYKIVIIFLLLFFRDFT